MNGGVEVPIVCWTGLYRNEITASLARRNQQSLILSKGRSFPLLYQLGQHLCKDAALRYSRSIDERFLSCSGKKNTKGCSRWTRLAPLSLPLFQQVPSTA